MTNKVKYSSRWCQHRKLDAVNRQYKLIVCEVTGQYLCSQDGKTAWHCTCRLTPGVSCSKPGVHVASKTLPEELLAWPWIRDEMTVFGIIEAIMVATAPNHDGYNGRGRQRYDNRGTRWCWFSKGDAEEVTIADFLASSNGGNGGYNRGRPDQYRDSRGTDNNYVDYRRGRQSGSNYGHRRNDQFRSRSPQRYRE